MPDVTVALGRLIADTPPEALRPAVTEPAKRALADTVGCLVSGWSAPVAAPLATMLARRGEPGTSPVVGSWLRASPPTAALVNGSLVAALELDDVTRILQGHPSGPVLAAILGESGLRDITGAAALHAYVLGVEVSARVGQAIAPTHAQRLWHPTGTVGVFGAVAALARLRGLDATATATALGLAGSLSAGLKTNFKTMTKGLHTGLAAQSAFTAVDLAAAGCTASTTVFEAPDGYVQVYGAQAADADRIVDRLGDRWLFESPGDGLRLYPCHGATHRGLDAALTIRRREGLAAADIVTVRHFHGPPWFRWVPRSNPTTGMAGKFSMEYILSAAMVDGQITTASFTDDAVNRPEVRAFLDRIELIEDAKYWPADPYGGDPDRPPYEGYVRVEIETRSGAVFAEEVEINPGSPGRDLDWDDVAAKFLDLACTLGGVDEAAAKETFEQLRNIENASSFVDTLTALNVTR
jgi:2-methylcitrate dehydratase PrpD